jgi:hypothetical protein
MECRIPLRTRATGFEPPVAGFLDISAEIFHFSYANRDEYLLVTNKLLISFVFSSITQETQIGNRHARKHSASSSASSLVAPAQDPLSTILHSAFVFRYLAGFPGLPYVLASSVRTLGQPQA